MVGAGPVNSISSKSPTGIQIPDGNTNCVVAVFVTLSDIKVTGKKDAPMTLTSCTPDAPSGGVIVIAVIM
jgi:hypothetical protein